MNMISLIWWILALFRVMWSFWPQSGYIHPDEFFQSVEVAAGDIFHIDVLRTWEFTDVAPVRSIVPIYAMCGLPFLVLKLIESWLGQGIITTHTLITAARLTMTILSFSIDACVSRLSGMFDTSSPRGTPTRSSSAMILVASSYVTLVFFTRTFSNSTEAFLFAAILYFCMKESRQILKSDDTGKDLAGVTEKARLTHDSSHSSASSNNKAIVISFILVLGIFNRPTFILFAFIPYCYWITNHFVDSPFVASHALCMAQKAYVSAVFSSIFASMFIVCDSIYYGHITLSVDNWMKDIDEYGLSEFVRKDAFVTPLNFVMYNLHSNNLAEHGLHPRWLHTLVNAPVLFGVLPVFAAIHIFRIIKHRDVFSTAVNRRRFGMLLAFIFPLVSLSFFPHQELRFLVPLLLPLSILYSTKLRFPSVRVLGLSWILLNIFGCIFFGCLHQGGVISSISEIQKRSTNSTHSINHAVFWRTYMPPRHLFVRHSPDGKYSMHGNHYEVHDIGGISPTEMTTFLDRLYNTTHTPCGDVYLVSPGSLHSRLADIVKKESDNRFSLVLDKTFWPHVSTEDLPSYESDLGFDIYRIVQELLETSSLNLYKVLYRIPVTDNPIRTH